MEIIVIISLLIFYYGASFYFKRIVIPKIKGAVGEFKVSAKLRRLNKKEYISLNDVLLKNGNTTTQIDHIVISRSGIFVIETKNYKGWIHGHQNSEYWTQTIYKHKSKLRNPIKQNWVHIYAIKNILSEFKHIEYFSIIIFAGRAELKNITSSIPVIHTNKLLKTIKRLNETERLSYDQMKLIANKLGQHNIIDRKENRNHVKQVKRQIRERRKKEQLKICPRCGNDLIEKMGKYGRFYGCQNFPKCRFTFNGK